MPRFCGMDHWIEYVLQHLGAWGVALLMLLENVFPPLPSEVVMPWAGYAVSQGTLSGVAALLAGSTGSFAGAYLWYWAARQVGRERLRRWVRRYGAWLTLSVSDVQRTEAWFENWGGAAVLLCRMIPGIRTLISIPAGLTNMSQARFCVYTAVGTVAWTGLLLGLGWWLADRHEALVQPLSWVSTAVVVGLFLWWLYRLIRQQSSGRSTA